MINDDNLTESDRGLLYKFLGAADITALKEEQTADKGQILNSWKQAVAKDPSFLHKLSYLNEKGDRVPYEMQDILKHIPDETVTTTEWQETEQEGGKWVTTTKTTKGHLRKGVLKLESNDIQGFITEHIKLTQQWNQKEHEATEKSNIITARGRDLIFSDYGVFDNNGEPTEIVDVGKLKDLYYAGDTFSDKLKVAYPVFGDFQAFTQDLLTAAMKAKITDDRVLARNTKIPLSLQKDTPENILLLENAIKRDHKDDMARYLNMSLGQEEPGKGGPGPF